VQNVVRVPSVHPYNRPVCSVFRCRMSVIQPVDVAPLLKGDSRPNRPGPLSVPIVRFVPFRERPSFDWNVAEFTDVRCSPTGSDLKRKIGFQ